ncbi:MAG TPA: hypothetical protein VLU43_17620 [Anaeromyxobacteraceae bacterium]|nr:hypothetical protein [Anaeromyxobacteraceae bacterium]
MRALALALAAAALGSAGPATAGPSITLNGVSIDGVTKQRFENCTVVIDALGNVHIEAKGYAVKAAEAPPPQAGSGAGLGPAAPPPYSPAAALPPSPYAPAPAPPATTGGRTATAAASAVPGRISRRYFLATEQTVPGGAQFDVAIFINAQWIREVKSAEPQVVMEITKYLHPGPNKVVLAATKRLAGGGDRKYYTRDVSLKVVIGEGNVGGDHVMIDNPLLEMTRTAAETEDRTEEYVLEAR